MGRLRPIFAPIVSVAGTEQFGLPLVHTDPDGITRRFQSKINTEHGEFVTLVVRLAERFGDQTIGIGSPQSATELSVYCATKSSCSSVSMLPGLQCLILEIA